MAFKTVNQFNKERGYENYFTLRNDGDTADVIFLYRSTDDVLVADAHYIKSENYAGYIHCCGRGCPACGKNIAVRSKLFIPMYNIANQKIEFWDRNMSFENQLNQDVFYRYPNPSEYVFRITRHGQARDVNTTYQIQAVGKNTLMPYDVVFAKFHTKVPDVYETVIKEFSSGELYSMLNPASGSANNSSSASSEYSGSDLPSYQVTPRAAYSAPVDSASVVDSIDDDEVPFDTSDSSDEDVGEPDFS